MQVIVMTSDLNSYVLPGFFHQWAKYFDGNHVGVVVGFNKVDVPDNFRFVSQGNQRDFPRERWSHRLMDVLDNIADEVFLLMLDDYWLKRKANSEALKMMYDYMFQFQNVLKFDVAYDRLGARGADLNYGTLGYLDLVKSDYNSEYHMSLWGGLWRRDLMKKLVKFGESAQQLEIEGTTRLKQYADEMLVLGTRQGPLVHANILQGRGWNDDPYAGIPSLNKADIKELEELNYIDRSLHWTTIGDT